MTAPYTGPLCDASRDDDRLVTGGPTPGGCLDLEGPGGTAAVPSPERLPTLHTTVGWALALARHGVPVFPLHGPTEGGCSCGDTGCTSIGKHPLLGHGHRDATTDSTTIEAWFRRWPLANYGIVAGPGWWVLDVDGAVGLAELDRLCLTHGELPPTAVVLTGSGGLHVYFAGEPPDTLRNRAKLRPGLDVRAHGRGYVVGPASTHASGHRWRMIRRLPLAVAPEWLIAALTPPAPAPRVVGTLTRPPVGVVSWAVERVLRAAPGQRNDTLNQVCWTVGGRLAAANAGPAAWAAAVAALSEAAMAVEQDPETVGRVMTQGAQRPFGGAA